MTPSPALNDAEKAHLPDIQPSEKHFAAGSGKDGIPGLGKGESPAAGTEQHLDFEENPEDPNLVTWASRDDPLNPKNWSTRRKWSITLTMSAVGFVSIMSASIVAPALASMAKDLDMNNVESEMALSVYILAIAFGPLVLGPLSEVYGRLILLHSCNVWLLVWTTVCGFADRKGLLIAARLLAGFGGSLIYAVGEIWRLICNDVS